MEHFILSLDQGTTSSRAILVDAAGHLRGIAQQEFRQHFPQSGWVEHDPEEIWATQSAVIREVISKTGIRDKQISGIGITNQRETTVVWHRETGKPIYPAIVWQDRRTASYCTWLRENGYAERITSKTGLLPDAYFSATKVRWILENVPHARELAEQGKLAFGTIDTWLIWKLSQGVAHITDASNASRTMLYNIEEGVWDKELLELFGIPASMLPELVDSSGTLARCTHDVLKLDIPIAGIAGDQQAALFGQRCTRAGQVKNTYGTGCFIMLCTGDERPHSSHQLLSTVAWQLNGKRTFALEGSVFVAGALVQWLRDGLGIISKSSEIETLARKVSDHGGVYIVPALTGLGAPDWDSQARGLIIGLERGTTAAHIARAALEGIAFQNADVLTVMEKDLNTRIRSMHVDGGAAANELLMQFQADILNCEVIRPLQTETTALGAAYLAGLGVGFWSGQEELDALWKPDTSFQCSMDEEERNTRLLQWKKAKDRSRNWLS